MTDDPRPFVFFLIILAAAFCAGIAVGYHCGYRDGQIHALSGYAHYRLVQNTDGSRTWTDTKP